MRLGGGEQRHRLDGEQLTPALAQRHGSALQRRACERARVRAGKREAVAPAVSGPRDAGEEAACAAADGGRAASGGDGVGESLTRWLHGLQRARQLSASPVQVREPGADPLPVGGHLRRRHSAQLAHHPAAANGQVAAGPLSGEALRACTSSDLQPAPMQHNAALAAAVGCHACSPTAPPSRVQLVPASALRLQPSQSLQGATASEASRCCSWWSCLAAPGTSRSRQTCTPG